jgi:hypothetical protein
MPRNDWFGNCYESIITMGLRAENDSATPVGKNLTEQIIGGFLPTPERPVD